MNPNIEGQRLPALEPGAEVTIEPHPTPSSSLAKHLRDLSGEAATLVRGEIALARAEIDEKIDKAQRGVIETLAGGAIAYAGLLTLLAAAVFGLATQIPLWVAALIVGLGTTIVGALALGKGKHDLSKEGLKPKRLIEEGRKTRQFAQEQIP